ncbi:MAG: hypothetical protein FJ096_22755 [Deltaproteobacteria bacterium]|nr:hypothetical protein [Deltaproteobacteria bacterium]
MAGFGGCGASAENSASTTGDGVVSATVASGAGGTIIHDGVGGAGGGGDVAAPRCGEGCIPGVSVDSACARTPRSGSGGAGGGNGGGSAGELGGGGDAPILDGTCQLAEVDGAVQGVCGLAGTAPDGAPCLTSEDCSTGLGCVEPGVCRAYCCGDPEACPAQTFCSEVGMSPLGPKSVTIPVCEPARPCTLLDDTTCGTGETCTIVRADGTTSCVTSGAGKEGESCPCSAGFVCSFAEDRCMRLCRTNRSEDCPAGFQCSGGSKPYPAGYGVCVEL